MRIVSDEMRLSATDLANHLGCRHLTDLDVAAALGRLTPPVWRDPVLEVLQERGLRHETEYLEHLTHEGLAICRLDAGGERPAADRTDAAMRQGYDVIVQASLGEGRWRGRADILRRVDRPSALGNWSYQVIDTKLARQTRAGTILQLCLYSQIVGEIQETTPEFMHVVSPGRDFAPESYRVDDFMAYYRQVKARLGWAVDEGLEGQAPSYPEPVPQCDICRWWSRCNRKWHDDDHLSLVAGLSKLQATELRSRGVDTLEELAQLEMPLEPRPRRGSVAGYLRVRDQARVQLEGRRCGSPLHELLPVEEGRGFERLPEPSAGDIFFDIEGDAFVGEGGLEYLFGWVTTDGEGAPLYDYTGGFDRLAEQQSFERFVDFVMDRLAQFPDLHIYHFAPYEPSALKRLMGRYASRENQVDRMLRARLFVDLHAVVKQSLRASVERYSIKDLEDFYGFEREVPLREASKNIRALEGALELDRADSVPEEVRNVVKGYNRDDCVSTLYLRDWLERRRAELQERVGEIPRPPVETGDPSETVEQRAERIQKLMDTLAGDIPDDASERTEEEQARWLLSQLLEFHRREMKAPWWEYFRLLDLTEEDLLYEKSALSGLDFAGTVGEEKIPVHRYRYPRQDVEIRKGDDLRSGDGEPFGKVRAIDLVARSVDIKKRKDTAESHPKTVFAHKIVTSEEQSESLFRLARWVATNGIDAAGARRAARDLLLQHPPRLTIGLSRTPALQGDEEQALGAARRLVNLLDGGVLPIQGPPGAGKTYKGARMICDLVRAGKKVGITAVSHKVIRNLLDDVVEAAQEEGLGISCVQKPKGKPSKEEGPIQEVRNNDDLLNALVEGKAQVAGGTAWVWARPEFLESVDILFVDEAGQMSLADVLAVAPASKSLVLLGDPQQLEQPQQGSHPDGTGVSALEHLLGEHNTIPADRGLFLEETWRLHPSICFFTSEQFYEGRLNALPGLDNQAIVGPTDFTGSGLWFVQVSHQGNQSSSLEEAEKVGEIVDDLLGEGVIWVDKDGQSKPLTLNDVLIVAPYNAQVSRIGERIPGARVGTVDKFQGQQAPVVIYSLTTSSPEEAPRGMEFLYSLNRLNVATSRARCVCILVANPRLFEPECRTPRQMQLANAFCRYLEMAQVVDVRPRTDS